MVIPATWREEETERERNRERERERVRNHVLALEKTFFPQIAKGLKIVKFLIHNVGIQSTKLISANV